MMITTEMATQMKIRIIWNTSKAFFAVCICSEDDNEMMLEGFTDISGGNSPYAAGRAEAVPEEVKAKTEGEFAGTSNLIASEL